MRSSSNGLESRLVRLLDKKRITDADKLASVYRGPRRSSDTATFDSVVVHKRFDMITANRECQVKHITKNLIRARQDESFSLAQKFPQFFCIHGKCYAFKGTPLGCKVCP